MKVHDLQHGDLLQFVDSAGPVPDLISESCGGWGESIRIETNFNWIWDEGIVPRTMIYIGRKRKNGVITYEVLWNGKPRLVRGRQIRHVERVAGSENIQADGRASTPPNTKNMSQSPAARTGRGR